MGKRAIALVIILSLCVLAACGKSQSDSHSNPPILHKTQYGDDFRQAPNREALLSFITNQLSGSYGVYTNYIDTGQSAEAASGHEVLSESAGLLMRYYARTGQQDAFDREWERAKRSFDLNDGFSYRYSPKLNKKYQLNAAVDDLRIIRALHEAEAAFNVPLYGQEASTYGSRFYEHNVKDGYAYDFYDESYQVTNQFITLCYIDLKSLQLLPLSSKEGNKLMENMAAIARNGYLSDQFPFYETRYSYEKNDYVSENINTVESLLTILALSEMNMHKPESIRYLKKQVKDGTLYGQYSRSGVAQNQIQSTAIYAIAAMIGAETEDKALYEDSMDRMNQFRIIEANSPFLGGFADLASGQAYSFDNLMALLAYAY
ncbi:hypothetical protein AB4Z29_00910 [Paenibacillus sp. 2TAB23]|uniref:hypothetical protein n=1 Tax=Paenibacillus sp. 2TAB23 TaxID=3233004 RepID=UPI003F94C5D4